MCIEVHHFLSFSSLCVSSIKFNGMDVTSQLQKGLSSQIISLCLIAFFLSSFLFLIFSPLIYHLGIYL